MRVDELQAMLSNMPKDQELAVIFFDKDEAESIADKELTNGVWSRIVNKWKTNKTLNQIADETFSEVVWAITGERDSK